MYKIWFHVTGEDGKEYEACLAKSYKTKGNAVKYAKKVFGDKKNYIVAKEEET